LLIYFTSYYFNRRRGIDLGMLHSQIPPE